MTGVLIREKRGYFKTWKPRGEKNVKTEAEIRVNTSTR